MKVTRILWFLGLTLLAIGSAILLNSFATPPMDTGPGSSLAEFDTEETFRFVKGDELQISLDASYPTISHNITLKKVGSDWKAEKVLVGQGTWIVKIPIRGVYILTIKSTIPEEIPKDAYPRRFEMITLNPAPRIDLLEPTLYGTIIPSLTMIVASIYLEGKKHD